MNKGTQTVSALTGPQRKKSQQNIIYSSIIGNIPVNVLAGALMVAFLADTFHLDATVGSLILSLSPLISLVRFFLLGKIKKFSKVLIIKGSYLLMAGSMGIYILLPDSLYSYPLTILLIMSYFFLREVGQTAIWGHFLAAYSTPKDRGNFTARIRAYFQSASLLFDIGMLVLVGEKFDITEFKIAIFGIMLLSLNGWFWLRKVPEVTEGLKKEPVVGQKFSFRKLLASKTLGTPLVLTMFIMFFESPVLYFYLKYGLNLPSDLIIAAFFLEKIGATISLIFWGSLIDAIGHRTLNLGMFILAIIYPPLLWLVSTVSPGFELFADFSTAWVNLGILFFLVFFRGILLSGIGVGVLSLQVHAIEKDTQDSLLTYNLVTMMGTLFTSALFFIFGFLLDVWKSFRSQDVLIGVVPGLELNYYTLGFVAFHWLLIVFGIVLVTRKDDDAYSLRVRDFFSGVMRSPFATMLLSKKAFKEHEKERIYHARWLGNNHNPLSIPQLEAMLNDSAFDVKVEVIRSLAQHPCEETRELLRKILLDKESSWVWDQAAWALGETKDKKSVPLLIELLDENYNSILRSYAARALGKIGDKEAILPIVEKLEQEDFSLQFISSCCRALFRLDAVEYSDLVVQSFLKVRGRQERFEMMMTIAEWLGLRQIWTTRSSSEISAYEMICEYIDEQSERWKEKRANLIMLLDRRDYEEVERLYSEKIQSAQKAHPLNDSISQCLKELRHWTPLHGIAIYWLLQNYYLPKAKK